MGRGLDAFKALLPRSKVWEKASPALYAAIGAVADKVIESQDAAFEAISDAVDEWEQQFGILNKTGLSYQDRVNRIAGKWASIGGSLSNADLTFAIQSQGFTNLEVFYQLPGSVVDYFTLAPTQTPPNDGVFGYYLVNKLDNLAPVGGFECSNLAGGAECSDQAGDAECGGYTGYAIKRVYYPVLNSNSDWLVVCAVGTIHEVADVDADRQDELENLIMRIKPANRYAALMVRYI